MSINLTRRDFVRTSMLYGAGALLSFDVARPETARAAAASTDPVTFNAHEWATVEALTARILPSDEEPGALEANCVNFIDKALAHEDAEAKPLYQFGLQALDGVATARHQATFVALSDEQRDAILTSLESGDVPDWAGAEIPAQLFFETLRAHTIIAFLADPKYGGNRDYAGWKVAGYPGPRHRIGGYSKEQVEGRAPITSVWGETLPANKPAKS